MTLVSQTARAFKRHDTHRLAGVYVQESGCQLSIVEKLQSSFAQSCAGHGFHCISQPAIYLNPDDQLVSICAARILYAYKGTTEHSYAESE